MNKVALRLIVVVLLVVFAVVITTSILYKPDYGHDSYNLYCQGVQKAGFDLDGSVREKLVSQNADFNNVSLYDKEEEIQRISNISLALDKEIAYLLAISQNSKSVSQSDGDNLKSLLENYFTLRIGKNGTAYYVNAYYNYVQDGNFSVDTEDKMNAYNEMVSCICVKWKEQAVGAVALLNELKSFVKKYCYENTNLCDKKSILLDLSGTFSSLFINALSAPVGEDETLPYDKFVNNHYHELLALQSNINSILESSSINYSDEELFLCNNYFYIPQDILTGFLSSNNKIKAIEQQENLYIKAMLSNIHSYLGGH